MKLYNLNEKQAEDKINRMYGSAREENMCHELIKNYENVELYQISLTLFDGKIKYNCGDGEKIFEKGKYNPLNEEEKMNKDFIDCDSEHLEQNCIKEASKLLSDNSQCCWCDEMTEYENKGYSAALHQIVLDIL